MRIIAPVSEVDVAAVRPGQAATFTVDALPNRIFSGHVVQIRTPYVPTEKQQQSAQTQQNSITNFDSVIEVDNPDLSLRPSLTANVSIEIARRQEVLRVPNGAFRVKIAPTGVTAPTTGAPGPAATPVDDSMAPADSTMGTVYRLPNGDRNAQPTPVTVRIGVSNSIVTEILSGLANGDEVVTGRSATWELPERRSSFF
jgi:HlyD family secretion protein